MILRLLTEGSSGHELACLSSLADTVSMLLKGHNYGGRTMHALKPLWAKMKTPFSLHFFGVS